MSCRVNNSTMMEMNMMDMCMCAAVKEYRLLV